MSDQWIVLITGTSSGFGALAAGGATVYAGTRETGTRNTPAVRAAADHSAEHGRIDVLIHNAGHMAVGPTEAFTPEQLAELYDVNVLSTQRVDRAAPPGMRERGAGLVVRVSSSGVGYAAESARWGVETSIVVPGSFTRGTNHFAHAGKPADAAVEAVYATRYADLVEQVADKLAMIPAWNGTDSIGVQAHWELIGLGEGPEPGTYVAQSKVSGNGHNGTGPTTFRLRDGLMASLRIA